MRTAPRRRFALAAALAALAVAVPGSAPAAPAAGDEDWVRHKNDSETVEVEVPPSFQPQKLTKESMVLHLLNSGMPYSSSYVKVFASQGKWTIEEWAAFAKSDVAGTSFAPVEGKPYRFSEEWLGDKDTTWLILYEARVEGACGYYIQVGAPKEILDEFREDYDRILDSFVTRPPPADTYTVPVGWTKVQNDLYAVLGPKRDLPDDEAKKQMENRLFRILTWLDSQAPDVIMIRQWTGDRRKQVARSPIHVMPTREKFREAAGVFYREGASCLYLPQHPEKIVLVDGSPESGLNEHELCGATAVQSLETRMPALRPWLREGLRQYFEFASRRKSMPGLYPAEILKRAKDATAKPAAPFDDLLAKDEAGLRALGEAGAFQCWCGLYYGLHGAEGPMKDLFRRFREGLVGATDCQALWEKEVANYVSVAKKKFKGKDVDDGAKKYFKALKE